MTVPLIPFRRPEPQVFLKRAEAKIQEAAKAAALAAASPPKKKKRKSVPAKKPVHSTFTYENTENIATKSKGVQFAWAILSKMDPEGDLFVTDRALVIVDGQYAEEKAAFLATKEGVNPDSRRVGALKFDDEQLKQILRFAIPDAREEDAKGEIVPSSIAGVVFTPYQLIEMVFDLAYKQGQADEKRKVTAVLSAAASDDDDDDDDSFDEDEDLEDEDLDDDDDDDLVDDEDEEEYDNDNEEE